MLNEDQSEAIGYLGIREEGDIEKTMARIEREIRNRFKNV
jgi:hypothetical protein